jgi:multiple sugar transport system substrate-binding protein
VHPFRGTERGGARARPGMRAHPARARQRHSARRFLIAIHLFHHEADMTQHGRSTPRGTRAVHLTRRDLIRAAGAGAAVAAGAGIGLFGGKAPAFAQGVTLHTLNLSNFVPAIDAELNKLAAEFEKLQNCTVKMEFISLNDVLPRAVAAVEAKTGPDVILLQWNQGQLFDNSFSDVGDVVKAVGGDKMYKSNREAALVKGVYRGVPIYNVASAMTYNKKYCESVGVTPDKYAKTYDDLRRIGALMKKGGKPVGWCLGHTIGDGCFGNYPILWSFGAAEVDEKGRVIIDSKETREALKWMRAFWTEACDETGTAWNDASNNQAFLGESVGCVLNAASIYIKSRADAAAAKAKGDDATAAKATAFADNIRHTVAPAGPAGRFELVQQYNHHIPTYSKNAKLAKDWLRFIGAHKQYERIFLAGKGFATGIAPEWDNHPMWKKDPLMEPYKELNKYSRNMGYKGPYGRGASETQAKYIIPDMLARAIQQDVESAVSWAAQELKLAYAGKV